MFRILTLITFFLTLCALILASLSIIVPGFPGGEAHFDLVWLQKSSQTLLAITHTLPRLASSISLIQSLGLPLLLFVMAWWVKPAKAIAVSLTFLLLSLGTLEIALNNLGWTNTLNFMPHTMDLLRHLLTGVVSLSVLLWLYWRTDQTSGALDTAVGPRKMAGFTFFVLFFQIALGLWLTLNLAGAACSDFPACFGSWWPQFIEYWQNFDISVLTQAYKSANWDSLQTIHGLHRLGAVVTGLILLVLAFLALSPRGQRKIQIAGFYLIVLLLTQIGLGVLQGLDQSIVNVSKWMVLIKLGHSLISVKLLMLILYIRIHATRLSGSQPVLQPDFKPASPEIEGVDEIPVKEPENLLLRLQGQLHRTRGALTDLTLGKKTIDGDVLEALESRLIMADIGVEATASIIGTLTQSLERNQLKDVETVTRTVRDNMLSILQPCSQPLQIESRQKPFVILVVGVNGVGKTTTIGKLAHRLQHSGHKVMLAAGDTFRAAAVEQLQTWGERNQVPVVAQHSGADSASVIYDAVQSAQAKGIDVLIADTAGRLQTKSNLMDELSKIKRIMGKLDADAPHEVLLVLDAGTGQNALSQVKQFKQAVDLTGIALTKLDGTAKGGMIIALAKQFAIPIRFIGVGEGIDDLQDFEASRFIDALFGE